MNRIKQFLHDRRARKLGLTFMQINGGDCARCGQSFGNGRYPSLYSPARGVRVFACHGGCDKSEAAFLWLAEGNEIDTRIEETDWAGPLPVYDSMDALLADLEADDSACSCGGDPDTCEANQAVAAEIAAEAGREDER